MYAHRLVGEYFLDKPNNWEELEINHKDFNKENNHYSNLEWISKSDNMKHLWVNKRDEIREKISTVTDIDMSDLEKIRIRKKKYRENNKEKIKET